MTTSSQIYKQELYSLYKDIAAFAKKNEHGSKNVLSDNPHVNRLIQAFGVIASNLSIMIEENSTEVINLLFDTLYAHYNSSIPSISIITPELDPQHDSCLYIPKNQEVEMVTENSDFNYKFQTCYDSKILPLKIDNVLCEAEQNKLGVDSFITIKLSTYKNLALSKLDLKTIRFFVQGISTHAYLIHYNIMDNLDSVVISGAGNSKPHIILAPHCIKKVGFDDQDMIVPYPKDSFLGYRLLTELAVFPEKFLFFDIELGDIDLKPFGHSVEILFYFKDKQLLGKISGDNFLLNCVPVINLSEIESDPIEIQENISSYPLVINKNQPKNYQICSIKNVWVNIDNKDYPARKLLGLKGEEIEEETFCYVNRNRYNMEAYKQVTSHNISVVDSQGKLFSKTKLPKYFYVNALCSNGDLPNQFYDSSKTNFKFSDSILPISSVKCVVSPTLHNKIAQSNDQKKHLLAHLSLNYLNITNENVGELLKKLLSLYKGNGQISSLLFNSIISIRISPDICRLSNLGIRQFYKGSRIEIQFDNDKSPKGLLYLFSNILEHFFAIYCSINSFIRFVSKDKYGEIIYAGKPKNGSKCLI